jgi:hypothetical protein
MAEFVLKMDRIDVVVLQDSVEVFATKVGL